MVFHTIGFQEHTVLGHLSGNVHSFFIYKGTHRRNYLFLAVGYKFGAAVSGDYVLGNAAVYILYSLLRILRDLNFVVKGGKTFLRIDNGKVSVGGESGDRRLLFLEIFFYVRVSLAFIRSYYKADFFLK